MHGVLKQSLSLLKMTIKTATTIQFGIKNYLEIHVSPNLKCSHRLLPAFFLFFKRNLEKKNFQSTICQLPLKYSGRLGAHFFCFYVYIIKKNILKFFNPTFYRWRHCKLKTELEFFGFINIQVYTTFSILKIIIRAYTF